MARYKKMLVAFDGSESSRHALKQAIKLAGTEGAWIKVVTVLPEYEGDLEIWVSNVRDSMRKSAETMLDQAKAIANSEGDLINTFIAEGKPFEKIVELADECGCELIVMGRRGKTHLERALVGSVTARVIGNTLRDVMVVPQNGTIGWRKIILATDGSSFSDLAAERAFDFARSYGGEITILSVVDVTDEFATQAPQMVTQMITKAQALVGGIGEKALAQKIKATCLVKEGEAHEVITNIAVAQGADVIVMGSHGKTGLRRLLMGSVTEKVIGLAPCPVLVARG